MQKMLILADRQHHHLQGTARIQNLALKESSKTQSLIICHVGSRRTVSSDFQKVQAAQRRNKAIWELYHLGDTLLSLLCVHPDYFQQHISCYIQHNTRKLRVILEGHSLQD